MALDLCGELGIGGSTEDLQESERLFVSHFYM